MTMPLPFPQPGRKMPALDIHEHEGDKYVLVREDRKTSVLWVLVAVLLLLGAVHFWDRGEAFQARQLLEARIIVSEKYIERQKAKDELKQEEIQSVRRLQADSE